MSGPEGGPGEPARPGPESPFHVPPPSTRWLRWSLLWLAVVPAFLLALFVWEVLTQQWLTLAALLPGAAVYGWLRWRQYPAVLAELRRRRDGGD